jgi:hypothetical protein
MIAGRSLDQVTKPLLEVVRDRGLRAGDIAVLEPLLDRLGQFVHHRHPVADSATEPGT